MPIKINKTDITLRPSSIVGAQTCGYKWAKTYLEGCEGFPNARAAIGTGIHRAAETLWTSSIKAGEKQFNMTEMHDAAIEVYDEELRKGIVYSEGESTNDSHKAILSGTGAFVEDLVPWLDIPQSVEQRFTMPLDHVIVKELSGSVDYLGNGNLDDLKTSKRKVDASGHVTQQTIYKMLAEHNGVDIKTQRIQAVVLTKKPYGEILELTPNIEQTKYFVNNLLDKIEVLAAGVVPGDVIFSCNTKDYLCSPKFCSQHGSCPATKRNANAEAKVKL